MTLPLLRRVPTPSFGNDHTPSLTLHRRAVCAMGRRCHDPVAQRCQDRYV